MNLKLGAEINQKTTAKKQIKTTLRSLPKRLRIFPERDIKTAINAGEIRMYHDNILNPIERCEYQRGNHSENDRCSQSPDWA